VILYTADSVQLIQKTAAHRAALKHVGNIINILNNTLLIWTDPVRSAANTEKPHSGTAAKFPIVVMPEP